ncbi:shikimate kinase [Histidinibacterium aquaticum]|uniref:Shikimate kinase n=1 Tax=Histidinibacterium aquaticum TaxID=2613962 RepID=A0A5J5GM38_9RHOB|nr:shikimate kinase [Histidinibacterium aquaticum]KAA9008713.1 shikimate kinase [Histidinibacterium aquaticum]
MTEQRDRTTLAARPKGRLKRAVTLVGMMGSGKTAIGRSLAARLDVPFRDSDHEIEAAAAASIAEIFARDGESFFRDRESAVIRRLLAEGPGVLSTGGGAYLSEQNRQAISEAGVAVWLDADLDLLWDRVRHKETRPLLKTPDPKGTLTRLYEERLPVYRLADLSVPAKRSYSIEDMTDAVIRTLSGRPDVLERLDA